MVDRATIIIAGVPCLVITNHGVVGEWSTCQRLLKKQVSRPNRQIFPSCPKNPAHLKVKSRSSRKSREQQTVHGQQMQQVTAVPLSLFYFFGWAWSEKHAARNMRNMCAETPPSLPLGIIQHHAGPRPKSLYTTALISFLVLYDEGMGTAGEP